jgi:hypothetical protein
VLDYQVDKRIDYRSIIIDIAGTRSKIVELVKRKRAIKAKDNKYISTETGISISKIETSKKKNAEWFQVNLFFKTIRLDVRDKGRKKALDFYVWSNATDTEISSNLRRTHGIEVL